MDKKQVDEIISVLRHAFGWSTSGPSLMELSSIALAGEGIREPVGPALSRIADAIQRRAVAAEDANEIAERRAAAAEKANEIAKETNEIAKRRLALEEPPFQL